MTEQQAPETTEATAAPVDAAPAGDEDAMAAAWDRMHAEGDDEPAPVEEAAAEAAEAPDEAVEEPAPAPVAPVPEMPSNIPITMKPHWEAMTAEQRETVLAMHGDMTRRLADQGRQVAGLKPIISALTDAAQKIPTLAGMKPEEIARDMTDLAPLLADLRAKPAETLQVLAERFGAADALRQAFGGQAPTRPAVDPDAVRRLVSEEMATAAQMRMVDEFASAKPHWAEVENAVIAMLPLALQQHPEAAPRAVLEAAYDMAVHANPTTRAKVAAAAQAPAAPSPELIGAQRAAKEVNLSSRATGKPRPLTEDERMAAAWDRLHQS